MEVLRLLPDHGNSMNFRGLNTSMFTSNNPVVIYIDGVPYSDRYGFDASLANVKRIEVLRGPQGTLYGKDAIGGVINIVTKDPGNEFQGKVGAEYGSFNYFATAGTAEDNSFEPQRSANYEAGLKGSLDRLRVAASVFYMARLGVAYLHPKGFYSRLDMKNQGNI
jgi:outer membrane receptor protein involved in Fe transport